MLADVKLLCKAQPASAFMFATSLCALVASAIGVVTQFARGNVVVGATLAAVVLGCALMAWNLGAAILAVARRLRLNATTS